MRTHLADIVGLLLGVVDELGELHVVCAEPGPEVEGLLGAGWGGLQVQVIHVEPEVVTHELKPALSLANTQRQVLKVKGTLKKDEVIWM